MIYSKSTIKGALDKLLRDSGLPNSHTVENIKDAGNGFELEFRPNPKLNRTHRQFIYKTDVAKEFVSRRKLAAKTLWVHQVKQEYYLVENPQKQTIYLINNPNQSEFICHCPDYQNMKNNGLDNPVCKHGYAVLNSLGYESLQDYLNR